MTRVMTKPWAKHESFYRDLVEHGLNLKGMLRLVEQIRASPHEPGLHAWTSMHDLCVVQTPYTFHAPHDRPHLRISPRFDGTIEFRYLDTHIENKQWHRVVNEDDAFARLERFMEQVHWIARRQPA
jgi:hypothetical protein